MFKYMWGMEKGQCSMLMKKPMPRLSENMIFRSFGASSREEKAYAFSAAEDYSGCVWPRRTYTCSFCDREFRSAQALGGHMNVHRRDRARLKHNQEANQLVHHHDHILEANTCFGAKTGIVVGSKNLQEDSRKPDVAKRESNNGDAVVEDSLKNLGDGEIRTDLSVGLNSELCQKIPKRSSCKRAKTDYHHHDVSSRLPLMLELVLGVLEPTTTVSKNDNHYHHEELDLELRLGAHDPQKAN